MDTSRFLVEVESEISRLQHIAEALRGLASNGSTPQSKRKGISAAGRRRISLAQKARWAKSATKGEMKPKRTMSASARRKIAAAQRARWAKVKKAA
jgi:hypothetical protein